MDKVDVSIIIVNYNTEKCIFNCLSSIYRETHGLFFEIIVVDNASIDNSVEIVKQFFPEVILIQGSKNMGFANANNWGFTYSKGRNIFFLNPDTILVNNAVYLLSDFLDNKKKVGICGANLFNSDMSKAHSFKRLFPSIFTEIDDVFFHLFTFLLYRNNREFNITDKPLSVGYITGADLMIKRTVLDEVGCFDSDFFMYYEETELTWRVKKAGYDVYSVPKAEVIHLEGKSFTFSSDREKRILNGRFVYFNKIYSVNYNYISHFINLGFIMIAICLYSFFNKRDVSLKYRERYRIYKDIMSTWTE